MLDASDTIINTASPDRALTAISSQQRVAYGSRLTPVPRIDSLGLLQGNRELIIEHVGLEYRLQVTRNGKLILTK